MRDRAALGLLVCLAVVGHVGATARAADIEITGRTGDVIGEIAKLLREIRFAPVADGLRVRSDSMTFDYRAGQLQYRGNVNVTHGEVRLRADDLVIAFAPGRVDTLRDVKATGDVRVVRDTETAEGQVAIYDKAASTLTLTGEASLGSGANSVNGEKVVVYLDEGRTVIEGGEGRVRALIDPGSIDPDKVLE